MPNHVTNEIRGSQRALASLLNDKGEVDFAFLIPPPPNLETGGCDGRHAPGVVCWYEWNVTNWGTKWNAYGSEVSEGLVRFDTAWSHPEPVIMALSHKHPDETFAVRYADEDLGQNLGDYTVRDGQVTMKVFTEGSEEALDFACQLKSGQTYAEMRAEWGDDDD